MRLWKTHWLCVLDYLSHSFPFFLKKWLLKELLAVKFVTLIIPHHGIYASVYGVLVLKKTFFFFNFDVLTFLDVKRRSEQI